MFSFKTYSPRTKKRGTVITIGNPLRNSATLTEYWKSTEYAVLLPVELSLRFRRWFRRLCTFLKIKIHGKPKYLLNKTPSSQIHYNTRNTDQVETYYCRTDIFKNSFFPYTIIEWNKLDLDVCKSKSYAIFRNTLLKLHSFS